MKEQGDVNLEDVKKYDDADDADSGDDLDSSDSDDDSDDDEEALEKELEKIRKEREIARKKKVWIELLLFRGTGSGPLDTRFLTPCDDLICCRSKKACMASNRYAGYPSAVYHTRAKSLAESPKLGRRINTVVQQQLVAILSPSVLQNISLSSRIFVLRRGMIFWKMGFVFNPCGVECSPSTRALCISGDGTARFH